MAREFEGYRDIVGALAEKYGKSAINRKELAKYLGCHEQTAKRIAETHKIPTNCGLMDIHLVARALCKGG